MLKNIKTQITLSHQTAYQHHSINYLKQLFFTDLEQSNIYYNSSLKNDYR